MLRGVSGRIRTYGIVGNEMMHVVAAFPPSDGQATNEVADEDADQ